MAPRTGLPWTRYGSLQFEFPTKLIVPQVKAWFEGFIADDDVLESTKIDIGWCEYAVCQTGAAVKNLWEVLAKTQKVQRELIDIGVLRYPSKKSPHFKVCGTPYARAESVGAYLTTGIPDPT